jgi:ornithine cyclodeaminase
MADDTANCDPLVIDCDTIDASLTDRELIEVLREGHARPIDAVDRLVLSQPAAGAGENHLLVLPAWRRGAEFGAKLVSHFPGNRETPTIATAYVLFEGRNGRPVAFLHGDALTLRKTAADSALGASYLARRDARVLLMVGAGRQALPLVRAHLAARPGLRQILVWNRTVEHARALVKTLGEGGLDATVADDLESAARAADIISCATASTKPLIEGRWLRAGTHLDLVGGYTRDMREADDEAARRASVFIDSRAFTRDCGDTAGPIASGAMRESDIRADLFDLVQGRHPGRRGDDEITLFKNGGGGHLDLMVAKAFVAAARVLPLALVGRG